MNNPAALERHATVLALRHDDLRTIDHILDQPARNVTGDRHPITDRETGLRQIDADVVGALVSGDQIEPQIRAVALRIDGKETANSSSAHRSTILQ